MKNFILMLLLMLSFGNGVFKAQKSNDTLKSWVSKFYKLDNLESSKDGKWIALKKWYSYNRDTTLIFNTQKPNTIIGTLVKVNLSLKFLKEDAFLASDVSKAEFWNLKTGLKLQYDNVKKADALSETNRYCILGKTGTLTVYDNGSVIHRVQDVQKFQITDGKKKLFAVAKDQSHYQIIDLSGNEAKELYSSFNEINSVELTPSGKYLIVSEFENASPKRNLILIDVSAGKKILIEDIYSEKSDKMQFDEIQDGKAFLISSTRTINPADKSAIDIWYSNDDNLEAKKYGTAKRFFWLVKPGSKHVQKIPNEKFSMIASCNNLRYLLAFNPREGHNYITWKPQLKMQLYDSYQNNFIELASLRGVVMASPEIVSSPNGQYILASENGEKWTLFETGEKAKHLIDGDSLYNPTFSTDGNFILFDSADNDLWTYNLKTKKLTGLNVAKGKKVSILNSEITKSNSWFNFSVSTINLQKPFLLRIWEKQSNKTTYATWQDGRITEFTSTSNNIVAIVHNDKLESFCSVEENHNMPPKLFLFEKRKAKSAPLFVGHLADNTSYLLKQDIIHYKNSQTKPLKGILYYPARYNPKRKYPMVVHIYQLQSQYANVYNIPSDTSPLGFDLRILQERGYFVYMPDIETDRNLGPGLSALDCINNALDAVGKNPNIDFNKIGLIGHSFGGYETDFIATHSDRFATYISGSGHSDIIRAYNSYNNNFNTPYYYQFESGIFDMKPIALDKDKYFQNNPINFVEKVNVPMLLWAGRKDENVSPDQVMEFYIGLKRNNKNAVALFYPNKGHDVGVNTPEGQDLHRRMLEWWDYFLKDKKKTPWIDQQMAETKL